MNRNLIFFTSAILLLAACRQQENTNRLKEISDGFVKANNAIYDKNRLVYEELEEKSKDPRTHNLALIWLPRAKVIFRQASKTKAYIDSLKDEIIIRSDSCKKSDEGIVQHLMEISGKGVELFNRLALFKDSLRVVFRTDEFIGNQFLIAALQHDSIGFHKFIPLLSRQYISLRSDGGRKSKEWTSDKFYNSSPSMAIAILNKIQSDVILTENFLVEYCNYQVIDNFCGYFKFEAIGSISSRYVKSGDTVDVTAGVGKFDNIMRPRITIDGIVQRLNSKKVSVHTFIAKGRPGKRTIPVTIEYIESDGTRETVTKEISYYIVDPK